jgi:hypothetical protein
VLWGWLRTVTTQVEWTNEKCVATFPSELGLAGVSRMQQTLQEVWAQDAKKFPKINPNDRGPYRIQSYENKPTPVDAPVAERLGEMMADRGLLCIYDERLQNAEVVHLKGEYSTGRKCEYCVYSSLSPGRLVSHSQLARLQDRLLVHFYAFLFFENWKQDLWMKRFVRDHLRYLDEIQCAAARVVAAVRNVAVKNGDPTGSYDSFHIRRGDFQYKEMHMPAEDVYNNNTKGIVPEGRTVYIGSDERNKTYFDPLRKHYTILFLDDFMKELGDLNPNYFGMVDQLIMSRGKTFFGAYMSTFTGYIERIRGYHAQKIKAPGHSLGTSDSYFYTPDMHAHARNNPRKYLSIRQGWWMQEFPVGWRDLDHDVTDISR